ncbi:MAG: endonuclease/exonuclease/phosphatase family protein [Lewinella sp.]|nr:endonuclease/exonuclease/phosphatase family protein [Lewinella sp.]
MKPILISFLLLSSLSGLNAQTIKAMTYNLRYDNPGDGDNTWDKRKGKLVALVNYYAPDVLGTQEGLKHQLDYMQSNLNGYAYYGAGRDDGKEKGEYSAIFYRKDRFDVLESATFWLSPTPDQPTKGWDAALPRVCSYLLLKDKQSHKKLWVFNTHFDHVGKQARVESAKLILEKIQAFTAGKKYPVILTGDFNLTPDETAIATLKAGLLDAHDLAGKSAYGPEGTFNSFEFNKAPERRIDYVFTGKQGLTFLRYAVIDDFYDFKYPSDHLPVLAEFRIGKK